MARLVQSSWSLPASLWHWAAVLPAASRQEEPGLADASGLSSEAQYQPNYAGNGTEISR